MPPHPPHLNGSSSGAKHQLEHRVAEKLGLNALASVYRRIFRPVLSAAPRAGAREAGRLGERAATHFGERAIERAAEAALARTRRALGARLVARAIRGIPTAVPILGGLFALALVRSDVRRRAEARILVPNTANWHPRTVFGAAAFLDAADVAAHVVVVAATLGTHVHLPGGLDLGHVCEWASVCFGAFGTGAAIVAELMLDSCLSAQSSGSVGRPGAKASDADPRSGSDAPVSAMQVLTQDELSPHSSISDRERSESYPDALGRSAAARTTYSAPSSGADDSVPMPGDTSASASHPSDCRPSSRRRGSNVP